MLTAQLTIRKKALYHALQSADAKNAAVPAKNLQELDDLPFTIFVAHKHMVQRGKEKYCVCMPFISH